MLLKRALFILATVVGCADGDAGDAAADAADAAGDAGRDSAQDASDASPDARDALDADETDAGPAEWTSVPGLSSDCPVELAQNPAALANIEWNDCGAGCTHLVLPSGAEVITALGFYDERGYFLLRWEDTQTIALADSERVVGGWRSTDDCKLFNVVGGGGRVAYQFVSIPEDGHFTALYHVPNTELHVPREPLTILTSPADYPYGAVLQHLRASGVAVAGVISFGDVVLFSGGELYRHATPDSVAPNSAQLLQLVDDHVLWAEWRTEVRLAHGSVDLETEVFHEVAGARLIGLTTDGTDIAWAQCYGWNGSTCERFELWTAPYTRDAAVLAPRMVLEEYGGIARGVVGGGRYVEQRGRDRIEATNLATGEITTYDLSEGASTKHRFGVTFVAQGGQHDQTIQIQEHRCRMCRSSRRLRRWVRR